MHRLGGLEKDNVTSAISTDPTNHQRMTDLRQAKIDYIANCIPALEVKGNPDADLLVVGWGGTYGHLYSVVNELNHEGKKVALAHFNYINPLPANTAEVLKRYKKVVVCEQNNGQVCHTVVRQNTGTRCQPVQPRTRPAVHGERAERTFH